MNRGASTRSSRVIAVTLISALFSVALSAIPQETSAQITSVQTNQVLPLGGNNCTALTAYSFTAYVYDGALHSFEFTVSDNSYVAISGTLGGESIPFLFMTRRYDSTNALRVHVDVETTPIFGTLPLSVTLLSAKEGGGLVCMSFVAMVAASTDGSSAPVSVVAPSSPTPISQVPAPVTPAPVSPTPSAGQQTEGEPATPATSTVGESAEEGSTQPSVVSSFQNKLVELCATGNAPRLWVVLLTVFAVIMVIAALVQPPASWGYSTTQRAATLVAPFVLLAAFWYFAESCRVSPWILAVAIFLLLAGLVAVYREHRFVKEYWEGAVSFFGTPEVPKQTPPPVSIKQTTMITPPPQPKKPTSPPEVK